MSNIKIMNNNEKYAHATIGCIKGFTSVFRQRMEAWKATQ